MKLIIDCRETKLIECLNPYIEKNENITIETKQLDLGDIQLFKEEELIYIFERKTLNDLLSSIKDGRYTEQSYRLLNNYHHSMVVYLIEGIMNTVKTQQEKKIITSAMTTISLQKNCHLWRTSNTYETAENLILICEKLIKDRSRNFEKETTYTNFVKKEKKKNITKENIGEIFLCQIPNISSNGAKSIMRHVNGKFYSLYDIIRNNPEELFNIKCGERKISKRAITNLIEYLED